MIPYNLLGIIHQNNPHMGNIGWKKFATGEFEYNGTFSHKIVTAALQHQKETIFYKFQNSSDFCSHVYSKNSEECL